VWVENRHCSNGARNMAGSNLLLRNCESSGYHLLQLNRMPHKRTVVDYGSVISGMCRRGTIFRRLTSVTENILRSPTKFGSIAVSFARAIVSVTQHWQSQIQQSYHPATQGILSFESQFSVIDESLFELARLCACVSSSNVKLTRRTRLPNAKDIPLSQKWEGSY